MALTSFVTRAPLGLLYRDPAPRASVKSLGQGRSDGINGACPPYSFPVSPLSLCRHFDWESLQAPLRIPTIQAPGANSFFPDLRYGVER